LVLEWAFPTFVADGTVEWVVDKEKLKNPFLGSFGVVRFGINDHSLSYWDHARWLKHRTAAGVNVD